MPATPEIEDLTTICHSFPKLPESIVWRDNILTTIEDMFKQDADVIFVEGEEGVGKTILLAQFACRHPENAISIFVRSTSRWAYDPELLKLDLINQLEWILNRQSFHPIDRADDAHLRRQLARLQAYARRRRMTFYFIVDGIHDIPPNASDIRDIILDMVPFGVCPYFRFLVSRLPNDTWSHRLKVPTKPLRIPGFTIDETKRFFSTENIPDVLLSELHNSCRGNPGKMASVKRILKQGHTDIRELITDPERLFHNLLDIEWRSVDMDDELQLKLLAMVAYDNRRVSLSDLADIFNLSIQEVRSKLEPLGFIEIDDDENHVGFVSNAFRRFAMNKLERFKTFVFDTIIQRLQQHPESDTSLTYLPEYMMAVERFSDLLEYMSGDYIDTLLSRAESLSIVRHNAQHGADAAFALERDPDLYRFAVNLATLRETFGIQTVEREIEALVALDQLERALNLIHDVSIKEYRLYLLTVLARALKLHDRPIDDTVTEQIRHLYKEVDIVSVQELAHPMAANLLLCFPDLAVDLVKRLGLNRRDDREDALDRALVALSLPTFGIDRADEAQIRTFRSLFVQGPLRWLAFETLARQPASELLAQINTVPNMTDRIFLLSEWAAVNKDREDAIDVVRIALEWLISSTEVAPNALILRKLALPLIHRKTSRVMDLVKTFDTQVSAIQHIGPTEEIIKLHLILAEVEAATDFQSARNRLVDTYLTITDFDDIVLQATCLASMLGTLTRLDPDRQLDMTDQLHTLVQQDLRNAVDKILRTSADHLRLMRPVIRILGHTHPAWALSLAQSLNTQERRDAAVFECIRSHIELPADKLDWDYILQCLTYIRDLRLRDAAKLSIVEELAHKDSLDLPPKAVSLLEPDLYDEMDRCEFCCYALLLLHRSKFPDANAENMAEALDISWRKIPSLMHRIDVGFRITSLLSTWSRDMAISYLNRTRELAHRGTDDDILFLCLKLAIRAYSGLLAQDLADQNDLEMLMNMINKVHTPVTKIKLLNELAVRMYCKGKTDQCRRIVSAYLRPHLPSHTPASAFEAVCLYFGAPALYCAHQLTAFELIGQLPRPLRDETLFDICMLRLFSTPPDEPLEFFDVKARNLSYEDLVDICKVLEQIEADYIIYGVIWHISEFLSSQEGRLRISQQQRFAIADRLESLISRKMPHPDFIQHNGFKIVSLAEVARIRQTTAQDWLDLVEQAKRIPNTSDKAYVLALIARALPNRQRERAKQLFQEARYLVDSIPNAYERLMRYQDIAEIALEFDPAMSLFHEPRYFRRTAATGG